MKTLKQVIMAVAFVFLAHFSGKSDGCVPLPAGVVAWWEANGNSSDTVQNVPGDLAANATYGPGKIGQAFYFDGNGDAVTLDQPDPLELNVLTIEGWICRNNTNQVSLSDTSGAILAGEVGSYDFGLTDSGQLYFARVGNALVSSTSVISDTNFHHVAVTFDEAEVILYIDGTPDIPLSYPITFGPSPLMTIGSRADGSGSFWGAIDELSVYSRPLSRTEIRAIASAGSMGKCRIPGIE